MRSLLLAGLAALLALPALAEPATYTVAPTTIADEKAVLATVESVTTLPARVRSGGTLVQLSVHEGDQVEAGRIIAVLADPKLVDRQNAAGARAAAAKAQYEQAEREAIRSRPLLKEGVVSPQGLEQIETALRQAAEQLASANAEHAALTQAVAEAKVPAPAAGRVVEVPVAPGAVLNEGEPVAIIATSPFTLRLRLPESQTAGLKAGDPVRLDNGATGAVTLIHPRIDNGTVVVDAKSDQMGDYFVGQRIPARIAVGRREALVLPADWLIRRFGLDYARLRQGDGAPIEVPVQRGPAVALPGQPATVEILSGLRPGDVVVRP